MSLVLDELPRDPDRLLLMLQQSAEVIAQHNALLASLQAERDAAQTRYEVAQAEIEKLRLLIRQLQRGQFGRRSAPARRWRRRRCAGSASSTR
jgi:hypothetical protein